MKTIRVIFDLRLYPSVAIVRATHRFSATHTGRIERADEFAEVTLRPRSDGALDITDQLRDAVIDETLRETVHARTAVLHDTLVAAAFAPFREKA